MRGMGIGLLAIALLGSASVVAAQAWQSDRGDGTYANPPLNADYPDPDIIRVGGDFYFITSTFANVPALTILTSKDLVNWRFASHVVATLTGRPEYDLKTGGAYRHGIFAPSLRHHDGVFYVAVTPVGEPTRIYRAKNVAGPWTMNQLSESAFDPGLFFDADGTAYIATASSADGTETLLSLDPTLRRITARRVIHYIKGAEGSKLVRRGNHYYLFNAIPHRLGLTVSRATALAGPWETRNQIDDTTGGHQGAIVDLPDGSDYGFVMIDAGAVGRTTSISPIHWRDGWPIWGTPAAPNRVPATARKPIQGMPIETPAASDDFAQPTLGLQWQWNHNPLPDRWSLTDRPGFLRLHAAPGSSIWTARNTLLQKGQAPSSRATITIDATHIARGDRCGAGVFGKYSGGIALGRNANGRLTLSMQIVEDRAGPGKTTIQHAIRESPAITIDTTHLTLRTEMDFVRNTGMVAYSIDGTTFTPLGTPFPLAFDWRTGTFQGQQFSLFCYNPAGRGGYLDIDAFALDGRR